MTSDQLNLEKSSVSTLRFADDLILFSETFTSLLNALDKLHDYCYNWQLKVNTKKT